MINEIISALLQVFVFTLIPFIVFLITRRTASGFFNYIGLKATTRKAVLFAALTSLIFLAGGISLAFLSNEIREILINPPSVSGKIRQIGFQPAAIFLLIIIAWFKTSLAEEILFRGFIAKRLINRLGFQTGNILQALIFAVVHVLLFWILAKSGAAFLVFIFLLSGFAGYIIEYINEKYGEGSIIPGWIAHATGNTLSYFVLAFLI
ncbi:MAG: CPBP family intramembrane glutamic endopeptidase [Pyrinomonadaceae bacterium]